jgi:amino acid adenylation domain-containing protein
MGSYLVQQYVDTSQELFPEKKAVCAGNVRITYEELYSRSNKLANSLISHGVGRQAFCLKRSERCIVAMAGILKADAIYVPIDSNCPLERSRRIVDDCKPKVVICDGVTVDKILNVIADMDVTPFVISADCGGEIRRTVKGKIVFQNEIDDGNDKAPEYHNLDTDIAYILYTSGSTGNPKGVMISHLNIINYVDWASECFEISKTDNILSTAPFHFDMSTFDIYCALKTGATLCIAPESSLLFPGKLLSLIEKERITIWKGVSSLIMYLARTGSLKKDRIKTLKKILFGGEVLATKYLIEWMKTYPDKKFYNVYGPTEATGISTYYLITRIPDNENCAIPIGKACKNTEVLLLKEDGSAARVGEMGELCIRGSGLSRGYWGDPEKTATSFVCHYSTPMPGDRIYRTGDIARLRPDGNYEYICRKDQQVKHMGYRIELSEIENAILSIEAVNEAAVILAWSDKYETTDLIAFYSAGNGISPEAISKELAERLPNYMLPKRIYGIATLPRTERGKIARNALQDLACNV